MANLTPEQTALLNLLAPGDYAWADLDAAAWFEAVEAMNAACVALSEAITW